MTRTDPFVQDFRPSRYRSAWGGQTGSQYRALCSDGVIRTATATAEADSFFTIPARVTVRGRTVTGHVYQRVASYEAADDGTPLDGGPRYAFSAYTYRKNADALPAWPEPVR